MSTAKKIWISIGVVVLVVILAGGLYVNSKFEKMDITDKLDASEAGVDEALKNLEDASGVINIALFGIDSRDVDITTKNARTDAMKIISIDKKNKLAKVSSFQRDTLIYIPGDIQDFDKLNHAYWYGGPTLALQTFNYNFDLDVKRYVTVNFDAVEHIVDIVGGVEINVSSAELSVTNSIIQGLNSESTTDTDASLLTQAGLQTLNGRQAVAYSRNRYVGNDFDRMERQTEIMQGVLEKVKSANLNDLIKLLDYCLPFVETNLTKIEMISLASTAMGLDLNNIGQAQVPSTGVADSKSVSYKGYSPLYVLESYANEVKLIHTFIYGNANYEPSSRVLETEAAIYNKFGRP